MFTCTAKNKLYLFIRCDVLIMILKCMKCSIVPTKKVLQNLILQKTAKKTIKFIKTFRKCILILPI